MHVVHYLKVITPIVSQVANTVCQELAIRCSCQETCVELKIWGPISVRELGLCTVVWGVHNNWSNCLWEQTRCIYAWQNLQRSIFDRCSSPQQSQPSQRHCGQAPKIYRIERKLTTIWQLIAIFIDHWYYTQRVLFLTLPPSPNKRAWNYEPLPLSVYSRAESSNTIIPYSQKVFGRVMNKKCWVSDWHSLKTS